MMYQHIYLFTKVCLRMPRNPPVYQCDRGHMLCNECHGKLNNCPVCRVPLGKTRSLITEKVKYFLKFDYTYAKRVAVIHQFQFWNVSTKILSLKCINRFLPNSLVPAGLAIRDVKLRWWKLHLMFMNGFVHSDWYLAWI